MVASCSLRTLSTKGCKAEAMLRELPTNIDPYYLVTQILVHQHGASKASSDYPAITRRRGDLPDKTVDMLELPAGFWQGLLQYTDHDIYLAVRLSCRCLSVAISDAHPLHRPSVASLLPLEILQTIYKRLDPVDFNAARSPSSFYFRNTA